jgi:fructokinase
MRLGIDLGGTKIEILALNSDGKEVLRQRVKTPRGDYQGIVRAIGDLVQHTVTSLGIPLASTSIGIGIPGTHVQDTGLIKNANTTELNGKPLWRDLEDVLKHKVRIANDANCFTLSEAYDGAAKGAPVVFGVILGTGCGGGIVVNGKVLNGKNGITGEWGHIRLPDQTKEDLPLPDCYCGQKGCLETYISGTGFARDYRQATGQALAAGDIVALAEKGDPDAVAASKRLMDRIARGLATVVNILDPDCIVLGGGLSNYAAIYREVPKIWQRYIFSPTVTTPIVRAIHGDSSGVRGAAYL